MSEIGHVGELISGYLDGELTQQQRQRVDVHVDGCDQCRKELEDIKALKERVGNARLKEMNQDAWREMMDDTTVRTTRGIGWLLLIGGVLTAVGIGVYQFLFESSENLTTKLVVSAIYLGLAGLFVSVLRQRLIERRTDKYEDVEI